MQDDVPGVRGAVDPVKTIQASDVQVEPVGIRHVVLVSGTS